MAFRPNPLSLNIPDEEVEAWLKHTGYLQSQSQSQSHTATANHNQNHTTTRNKRSTTTTRTIINNSNIGDGKGYTDGFSGADLASALASVRSIARINPLEKITMEDFCKESVPWTDQFLGKFDSYSMPATVQELESRLHCNTAHFAPNYLRLAVIIFICFLYNMPLALLGIAAVFGLWDMLRICNRRWSLQSHVSLSKALVVATNFLTMLLLVYCKVVIAFCWAGIFSFTVFIIHSSLKEPASTTKPIQTRRAGIWKVRGN